MNNLVVWRTESFYKKRGGWSKVEVGDVIGYAYNKYLGTQAWYTGKGKTVLVAAKNKTPIYADYDDPYPIFTYVEKGTIIADDYEIHYKFYALVTAHDYLMVRKSDVNAYNPINDNETHYFNYYRNRKLLGCDKLRPK